MQVKERKVFPQLAVKKERKTKETKHRGLEIPLAALRYVIFLSMWWPFTLYSIVCIKIYIYVLVCVQDFPDDSNDEEELSPREVNKLSKLYMLLLQVCILVTPKIYVHLKFYFMKTVYITYITEETLLYL